MFKLINLIFKWSFSKIADMKIRKRSYGSIKFITLNLKRQFPNATISINDKRPYYIYDDDMKNILRYSFVRLRKWRKERYDCDDFSFTLKGIMSWFFGGFAFGIVKVKRHNKGHQLNCYINQYGKFMFVEPQTGRVFSPEERPDYEVYWIDI